MSDAKLLALLERLHSVPLDVDDKERRTWELAQKTTWWGQRLDPKVFWKGKAVWLGAQDGAAARCSGRLYPPIPFNEPNTRAARDAAELDDDQRWPGVPELHFTQREMAFWMLFERTHLQTPERLEEEQFHSAEIILQKRLFKIEKKFVPFTRVEASPRRVTLDHVTDEERKEWFPKNYNQELFPKEAYTDEALRWALLLHVRQQFADMVAKGDRGTNRFLKASQFDAKEIAEPLSTKDLEAENGWKVAYLRRLQSAKVDDSYLWAYLDAWKLPATVLNEPLSAREIVMARLNPSVTNTLPTGPPPKSGTRIKEEQRIAWLEKNGEVPEGSDWRDFKLAEQTSWWGKPLDSKKFWKGHVIWLDKWAESAARRHGRTFPPMPYEDPTLPHYNENEVIADGFELDGPGIRYHWTSKERAFWSKFDQSHPLPTEKIERAQLSVAEDYFRGKQLQGKNPRYHISEQDVENGRSMEIQRQVQFGYPVEAFSDDALLYAYVMKERKQYEENLNRDPGRGRLVEFQLSRLAVDASYITNHLSGLQRRAAEEWKISYLKRLRSNHTDESYIKAYLKAWDLAPELLEIH